MTKTKRKMLSMKNERGEWIEICTTSDINRISQIIAQLQLDGETCKLEDVSDDDSDE